MATEMKQQVQGYVSFIKELVFIVVVVFLIRTFGFGLYQVPTGSMETTILVGERFFADKFTILFSPPHRGDIIAFNAPETIFEYSSNPFKRFFQHYIWGPDNLTKRVIGTPGDKVRGTIENGKPIIYLNGEKLDEPYLNNYPIVLAWKDDPAYIKYLVDKQLAQLVQNRAIDPLQLDQAAAHIMRGHSSYKSYDPHLSWDKQPFYDIKPERIIRDQEGNSDILYPQTASSDYTPDKKEGNYWGRNSDEFYVELGPDQYWAMGDNRLGSGDSRTWGPVNGHHIHGKIIFRIWSVDSDESWWILDLLKHPIDFFKRVRWNRFFQRVH